MEYIFSDKTTDYDGSQLKSHWIRHNFNLLSDAIVAFVGGCNVKAEHMVDLEDLQAGDSIFSEKMLHFVIEHFDISLRECIVRQRIFICVLKEALEDVMPGIGLKRSGDDLFDEDHKVTISIATKSPVSGLIHTGINISSKNTPVKTKGLSDYNINAKTLAEVVLKKYKYEVEAIEKCITKVKWVY
jgi:hypothetical protein